MDHDLWGRFPDAATHFCLKIKSERGWDPVGIPIGDGLERREIPVEFVDHFQLQQPGEYRLFFLQETETETGGRSWKPLGMSRVVGFRGESENTAQASLHCGGGSVTPPLCGHPGPAAQEGGMPHPAGNQLEGVLGLLAAIRGFTREELDAQERKHAMAMEREQAWWKSRNDVAQREHEAARARDREFLTQVIAVVTESSKQQVDLAKGELERVRDEREREAEPSALDVAQSAVEHVPAVVDAVAGALGKKPPAAS